MKNYNATQLLELPVNSVPESFNGKIKAVYKVQSGEKGGKPWKLQKVAITDGTSECEVMFDNCPDVPRTMEGGTLYIVACRGEKGLSGLKRKDNVWKDKTTPQMWVFDGAEVTFTPPGGAATPAARAPAPAPAADQPPARQTAPAPATSRNAAPAEPATPAAEMTPDERKIAKNKARAAEIKGFDAALGRSSAAYERCFDAAYRLAGKVNLKHKAEGGFQPSAETIEKIAACLMVQTAWGQKPAQIADFPVNSFDAYDATGAAIAKNGNGGGN